MSIMLTRTELYRPGVLDDRDSSDSRLDNDAMWSLMVLARGEARRAARDGRDWPDWVTQMFEWYSDHLERLATRRELRMMAR